MSTPQENMRNLADAVDSAYDTPTGQFLAGEMGGPEAAPREPKLRDADHASDSIAKLCFDPNSAEGIAITKLRESKLAQFDLVPIMLNSQPDSRGYLTLELKGSEVAQENEARKIMAFLDRHDDLINALSFHRGDLDKAAQLEQQRLLPEGYAQRFQASSIAADIKLYEDYHHPYKAAAAKAALDQLKAASVEPLSESDVDALLDVAIQADSERGLFA